MKLPVFLLVFVCIACFFSCNPGHKVTPGDTIVARWALQQQHAVLYEDGVKIKDTVFNASAKTYAFAQFNEDGTFSSSSVYAPAGNSLQGQPASANTTGTYTYSANSFEVIPGLAGWFVYITGSSTPPTSGPVSWQVTSLTGTNLNVHGTNTWGVTNSTGAHTYNQQLDYYYTR